jgi:ParE-like toxin of type II ParDE toxin-antitoxin system
MAEAAKWYRAASSGIEQEFLDTLVRTMAHILEQPLRFPLVAKDLRRAVLPTFPYVLVFAVREDAIVVTACHHTRRDPNRWIGR